MRGDQETGSPAPSSRPAPTPIIPPPRRNRLGAGQGEARLRSEALRQQFCLGWNRLEPAAPARLLFCASQREAATHDPRILAPLPTPFVSAARFAVLCAR